MVIIRLIEALRARPRLLRSLCFGLLGAFALWDALVLDKSHAHTAFEKLPGWWSLFGVAACAAIIVFAKWLGHRGVSQGEDYYE
jgi:hypothetical protein